MRNRPILMLAVFGLVAGLSMNASAASPVIEALKQAAKAGKNAKAVVCRKASAASLKFSIRSGSGKLCSQRAVAALAMALCKGYADFDSSGCYTKAKKALGTDDKAKAKQILSEGKKNGGEEADLIDSVEKDIED